MSGGTIYPTAKEMARRRVIAPELEQFIVQGVQLTGKVLGVGAYGTVEEVLIPGAKVAAKKLHPQLIDFGSPEQVRKWISDFVDECKLMSRLRHPHVVQFLGICYLPGSHLPILLMEELQTSLDSLLETTANIPLDAKVYLLTGTARGVVYLHSRTQPVIHRDLTARNILIDSGLTAKIADLGVARMVNIQPGQRAAIMTQGPGNGLYMPPESLPESIPGGGATRYNTSIDIFSFGVVAVFTLTQTFPRDIKGASYLDPTTGTLVARSEIERREDYINPMKASLGDAHPLVKMTLDCLEYDPQRRPSAEEVLTRLEEVGSTVPVPGSCAETKLELIRHTDFRIQQIQSEHQQQLRQLQTVIDRLRAEKQDSASGFEELISLQQQQLEVQRKEIDQLSGQLRSIELQPRAKGAVIPDLNPPIYPELPAGKSPDTPERSTRLEASGITSIPKPAALPNFDDVTCFTVKEKVRGQNKLAPCILAVSPHFVMKINAKTKQLQKAWPLSRIRRWADSPNAFTIDFGDYAESFYSVQTKEGERISELLNETVENLRTKK